MNINFEYILDDIAEVNSGQVGRSSSLWLLSYRRIADLGIPNFSSNGAAGQIPLALRFQNFSKTPRVGRNFIGDPLEVTISEARGSRSVLSDSYGRLADFVVSESTAEENYCSNFELLDSVLTIFSTRLFMLILEYRSGII